MLRSITIFSFFALATVLVIVLQPGPRSDYSSDLNENALHETSRNQGGVLQEPQEMLKTAAAPVRAEGEVIEPSSDASGGSLTRLQAALNASLGAEVVSNDATGETIAQPVVQAALEPTRASTPVLVQTVAPELRDMSWKTLNALNSLGRASKGPGQEGSLLNSIVRRSMGQLGSTPAPLSQGAVRAAPVLATPAQRQVASPSAAQKSYVVASGDTLALIAIKLYGSALATDQLLLENPALRQKPNALRIGQVLKY